MTPSICVKMPGAGIAIQSSRCEKRALKNEQRWLLIAQIKNAYFFEIFYCIPFCFNNIISVAKFFINRFRKL